MMAPRRTGRREHQGHLTAPLWVHSDALWHCDAYLGARGEEPMHWEGPRSHSLHLCINFMRLSLYPLGLLKKTVCGGGETIGWEREVTHCPIAITPAVITVGEKLQLVINWSFFCTVNCMFCGTCTPNQNLSRAKVLQTPIPPHTQTELYKYCWLIDFQKNNEKGWPRQPALSCSAFTCPSPACCGVFLLQCTSRPTLVPTGWQRLPCQR